MKSIVFAVLISVGVVAAEGDKVYPTLQVGTDLFTNAVVRKLNPVDGWVKADGVNKRVKLADLPENVRTNFLDAAEAAKFSKDSAARDYAIRFAAAKKAWDATEEKTARDYFWVKGQLQKKPWSIYGLSGEVYEVFEDGFLVRSEGWNMRGGKVFGDLKFVVNYSKAVAAGNKVRIATCVSNGDLKKIGHNSFEVVDCGKPYLPKTFPGLIPSGTVIELKVAK